MPTPQRENVIRSVKGRPKRGVDPKGYIATFGAYGVELRPLHSRNPEATVYVTWDMIYERAFVAEALSKKGVKRGARK